MPPNPASLFQSRCRWVRAHGRLVLGMLVGVLAAGQSSGCSRGPDLAGVYSLPSSDTNDKWAIESLIELRNDGTAVMQGLSMYPAQGSKSDVKVETRSEGTWRLEGESLVYQGAVATASTLEGEKHHGREPIQLIFTLSKDGDLLLAAEDMDSDDVRYIRDPRLRSE